jgi:hypothetical protein
VGCSARLATDKRWPLKVLLRDNILTGAAGNSRSAYGFRRTGALREAQPLRGPAPLTPVRPASAVLVRAPFVASGEPAPAPAPRVDAGWLRSAAALSAVDACASAASNCAQRIAGKQAVSTPSR